MSPSNQHHGQQQQTPNGIANQNVDQTDLEPRMSDLLLDRVGGGTYRITGEQLEHHMHEFDRIMTQVMSERYAELQREGQIRVEEGTSGDGEGDSTKGHLRESSNGNHRGG